MKVDIRRLKLQRNAIACRAPVRVLRAAPTAVRIERTIARRDMPRIAPVAPVETATNFLPDPYVDYQRVLTPQGGIAMIYKDLDLRLRHTIRRLLLWSCATGFEAWILFSQKPPFNPWLATALLIIVAIINWLIVAKPVEVYRFIEIRPDCIILEGAEIFWAHMMEGGWPGFRMNDEGNLVLRGTYGTRFVEYLTIRRFDEQDRTPEVFAAHLQAAMTQLWDQPG